MVKRTFSTHILDTAKGKAAANVKVTVYRLDDTQEWQGLKAYKTNQDGRCELLKDGDNFLPGIYKLTFHVGAYYAEQNEKTLYPAIEIIVDCAEDQHHYHIPLLLNPFGYTTYRGT